MIKHTCAQGRIEDLRYSKDSIHSITREALASDLDIYKHGVAKNHVDPFTKIRKRDFFDKVDSIRDNALKFKDVDEMFVAILKVNALLEDEHTMLLYSIRDEFPFRCFLFDEGLYIIRTDHDNRQYLFSKIISVNNIPVDSVIDQMAAIVPDKNKAEVITYVSRGMFDPFILHGLGITPSRDKVTYKIVTSKNDTLNITPVAVDKRSMKLSEDSDKSFLRFSRNETYWFKYIDTNKTLYFKYASCFSDKKHPYDKFETSLRDEIEHKKPRKIIIDMRDNRGGHYNQLYHFIQYLAKSDLNKKGHIYVLIGRKTFSAAIVNSVDLKNKTYAVLVGEETGGSVVNYGGVEYFDLPTTGLKVMYSTRKVATDVKYEGSLKPDIVIPQRFSDYLRGIDGVLDYAIQH